MINQLIFTISYQSYDISPNRARFSPGDAPVPSSVILWLRNELRLHDNPLLQQGLERVAQGAQSLQLVVCLSLQWEFGEGFFVFFMFLLSSCWMLLDVVGCCWCISRVGFLMPIFESMTQALQLMDCCKHVLKLLNVIFINGGFLK